MSKYIKWKDLYNALDDAVIHIYDEEDAKEIERTRQKIISLPTIDIVRCKDCKNVTYKTIPVRSQDVFYGCVYSEIQHDGDFYCAYGERIEK